MEKRHRARPRIALFLLLSLLILLLSTTTLSALPKDDSVKGSFKKMGKAIGQAGKEVGKSAAQAGKAVGKEAQKVWYRGVRVSKPALERARAETRQAMRKTIQALDRSIAALEKELARLDSEERSRRGASASGGAEEDD